MDTIHLVSHTHWDREWYLTFQQFRLKLIHLMDRLLEILDNDPDFKFFLLDGQTIILEDYLQIRPEREPDLVRLIKNGRLLIGPWYVSPDEFLVAPESHIRNLLEGDKLCQKYGGKMTVGYMPDNFGHIGQMPQILQGFGINSACIWRGLDDQPCELTWQAPGGSRVLLTYLRNSYSNAASLTTSNPDKFIDEIHEQSASLAPFSVTGQILLMHGTDHMEPLDDLTKAINNYQITAEQNNLIHSNLPLYFDAIRSHLALTGSQLPIVTGELRSSNHAALLQNILSTRIWLKQRNHDCEIEMLKWVEPSIAWTSLLNPTQPVYMTDNGSLQHNTLTNRNSILRFAWKLLMQCHPHDSICGTSIDQVANEMRSRFDQVDQINHELVNQTLLKICDQIDTRYASNSLLSVDQRNILSTIVVFNPNDTPQTGLVNLSIALDETDTSVDIIDDHGNAILNDQMGMGASELISMTADRKTLKQLLGMIHEGVVAGMVIRDFDIHQEENRAIIRATLSDHNELNGNKGKQGVAQLELMLADPGVKAYIIHAYSDPEIKLSMIASDVPGHGYRCYWIRSKSQQSPIRTQQIKLNPFIQKMLPIISGISNIPLFSRLVTGRKVKFNTPLNIIENEYFKVEVKPSENGVSITDKRTDQLYTGLNRFWDSADCGDLYNYCPPEHDLVLIARIKRIDLDNHKTFQKLIINYDMKIPTRIANDRKSRSQEMTIVPIISTITIMRGVPRIDIQTEIENHACDHRLRVHFPAPFISAYSLQDGHFEIVQRQIGIPEYDESWEESPRPEVPQCQFTSITNDHLSLTIANRGLPEVEVFNSLSGNTEIALTLLRCIGWLSRDDLKTRKGHAGPMGMATPDAQMIGKFIFDYSIIPGDKNWRKSIHHAYSFNAPLKSITAPVHPGSLPSMCSYIENLNEDFVITAIKPAEDDSGWIVRGFNILASPIDLSLKPWRPFVHAQLVSIDEKPIEAIPFSPEGNINLHVDGNKIVTIRFTD
jgi:mannosylglycerate hydrolase